MNVKAKSVALASLAAIAVVGFAGCSSNKPAAQGTTSAIPATSMAAPAMTATTSATADPAADLVGSGCPGYAAQHPEKFGRLAIPFWPRFVAQLVFIALVLVAGTLA